MDCLFGCWTRASLENENGFIEFAFGPLVDQVGMMIVGLRVFVDYDVVVDPRCSHGSSIFDPRCCHGTTILDVFRPVNVCDYLVSVFCVERF
jgi:hypothetical protein